MELMPYLYYCFFEYILEIIYFLINSYSHYVLVILFYYIKNHYKIFSFDYFFLWFLKIFSLIKNLNYYIEFSCILNLLSLRYFFFLIFLVYHQVILPINFLIYFYQKTFLKTKFFYLKINY